MQRKCYSYIRFSSKKQALGTSLDRQADIDSFLERHNLVLDTRLEDLGVSAYRGKNASKGQLGDFLALVRAGQIDTNSVLLIENFDRLSRQKIIKSTQIFIELMSQGIDLGILDLGRIYGHARHGRHGWHGRHDVTPAPAPGPSPTPVLLADTGVFYGRSPARLALVEATIRG
jgi:DNA invertase Pin-like site-specific DNA recombinase